MEIYVKNFFYFHIFSFVSSFKCVDFTIIVASNRASDDVTN